MVHFIHPSAQIGEGTKIGHFSVIMEEVILGKDCQVGNGVIIHPRTKVGERVRIDDHAVLGKGPKSAPISILKLSSAYPALEIGNDVFVGAHSIIYVGAKLADKVFVADLASIREEVVLEEGVIVGRGVTIENRCRVGEYTKVETEVYVTAYTVIEERCFIAPMVCMSNDNYLGRTEERFKHMKGPHIKRGARIGANAVLLPGIVIGEEAVVGAGSVVTKEVPPYETWVGAPARFFRKTKPEQLLQNCLPEVWERLQQKDKQKDKRGS
jgi:acetyltransferase-like isoleucine patch superfamily enzyme